MIQGKFDHAKELFQEAHRMRAETLGTNHPDYAQSQFDLAELYRTEGDREKALELYKSAAEIFDLKLVFYVVSLPINAYSFF